MHFLTAFVCYTVTMEKSEEISDEELQRAAFQIVKLLQEKGADDVIVQVTVCGAQVYKVIR